MVQQPSFLHRHPPKCTNNRWTPPRKVTCFSLAAPRGCQQEEAAAGQRLGSGCAAARGRRPRRSMIVSLSWRSRSKGCSKMSTNCYRRGPGGPGGTTTGQVVAEHGDAPQQRHNDLHGRVVGHGVASRPRSSNRPSDVGPRPKAVHPCGPADGIRIADVTVSLRGSC